MKILIHKNLGRYDFLSTRKEWLLQISIDGKSLSARWPEEDEPDNDGWPASDVIQLILDRTNWYLYISDREESRARAAEWMANATAINRAWAESRITELQAAHAAAHEKIASLRAFYLADDTGGLS